MKKRAKKEREEQLKATKKCSVTLKRIPANLLTQYGTYVEANTSDGALLPINQTSERARRLESRLARVVSGKLGRQKFNKNVNNGSNSSHQSGRFLRVVENKQNERCETHVKANACDGTLGAERQPAKRARRIKSCLDGVVPGNRGLQQSDNNLNEGSNSSHQFGRTSHVGEYKENERFETHANVSEGILVPVEPPAKRTRRIKSCIDQFVLENRDEFQDRDQNPVMQPVNNGLYPKLKMNTNIVTKNEECTPTVAPAIAKRRLSVVPELIPLAGTSENQEAKCSKCVNYEQIITQLEEKVAKLENAAIMSKKSHENDLLKVKLQNACGHSEALEQIDKLQDSCTRLLAENAFLRSNQASLPGTE